MSKVIFEENANYGLYQDFIVWSQKQRTSTIVSLDSFLSGLHKAMEQNQQYYFSFENTELCQLLVILKQQGFIHDFYRFPFKVESLVCINKKKEYSTFVVIYLKPWELLGNKRRFFHAYSKKAKFCFISYKQVLVLVNSRQQTYLFHTARGLVTQADLLKHKTGGSFIGCLR